MKYRVSVEGSGFQLDGKAGSFGFFTHCFVVADSAELAGEKAIASVRAKVNASATVGSGPSTQIHVEEVNELEGDLPEVRQQGLVWFEETDS